MDGRADHDLDERIGTRMHGDGVREFGGAESSGKDLVRSLTYCPGSAMTVEALAEAEAERTPKPGSAKPCAFPELNPCPGITTVASTACVDVVESESTGLPLVSNASASADTELAAAGLMPIEADRMCR